jgi:hypothetical protein
MITGIRAVLTSIKSLHWTAHLQQGLSIISVFIAVLFWPDLCLAAEGSPQTVRLRVFSLFRIEQLVWQSQGKGWLQLGSAMGIRSLPVTAADNLLIRIDNERLILEQFRGAERAGSLALPSPLTLALQGAPSESEFLLSIPGRIQRCFRGTLELRIHQGELIAVLIEDLEQLTGEVSAAEMASPALPQAIEAQAIVARSFLATHRGRHAEQGYDFCDTTHCQFTRGSNISEAHRQAARNTRDMIISYSGRPVPAYYAAVCSGSTSPLPPSAAKELGYPDILVRCPSCSQSIRAGVDLGMPVSPFSGAANGHSLGLCQAGALEMARQGRSCEEILRHFFPHCTIAPLGKK